MWIYFHRTFYRPLPQSVRHTKSDSAAQILFLNALTFLNHGRWSDISGSHTTLCGNIWTLWRRFMPDKRNEWTLFQQLICPSSKRIFQPMLSHETSQDAPEQTDTIACYRQIHQQFVAKANSHTPGYSLLELNNAEFSESKQRSIQHRKQISYCAEHTVKNHYNTG